MTYEQGGHSRGGLAVQTATGDTLTLADRIAHHFTTGMSTIENSFQKRRSTDQRSSTLTSGIILKKVRGPTKRMS